MRANLSVSALNLNRRQVTGDIVVNLIRIGNAIDCASISPLNPFTFGARRSSCGKWQLALIMFWTCRDQFKLLPRYIMIIEISEVARRMGETQREREREKMVCDIL